MSETAEEQARRVRANSASTWDEYALAGYVLVLLAAPPRTKEIEQ